MDFTAIFATVMKVMQYLPVVEQVISEVMNTVKSTVPSATPTPTSVVHPTTTVTWLQTALNKYMNAGLVVDGEYGDATDAALRAAFAKFGLSV